MPYLPTMLLMMAGLLKPISLYQLRKSSNFDQRLRVRNSDGDDEALAVPSVTSADPMSSPPLKESRLVPLAHNHDCFDALRLLLIDGCRTLRFVSVTRAEKHPINMSSICRLCWSVGICYTTFKWTQLNLCLCILRTWQLRLGRTSLPAIFMHGVGIRKCIFAQSRSTEFNVTIHPSPLHHQARPPMHSDWVPHDVCILPRRRKYAFTFD